MKTKLICIILSILFCTLFSGVNAISQEVSKDLVELVNAYNWASGKGITTMKTFRSARMGDGLTRGELAKMMSIYIEKMGGQTNYLNRNISYKDVNNSLGDLEYYIKKAYQYQIMGIDAYGNPLEYFNPYRKVTRAEFGTVFSRVLYGNKYNKSTGKYYENHLKALKNAGIMNKIDDPFQMEMRGYVMIMMMRTDKSFVPLKSSDEALIEQINEILKEIEASENETKQNENSNKKGTLIISSESAKDGKAIKGVTSDFDTITFKASDDLSIDKIILERYGYSSESDVDSVRLENQDGNMVSNVVSGLKNDKATLTIKKDYKSIYGTERWTIVVKLNNNTTAGGTIGFKLTDVTSSAKILDMDDYDVNTYNIVSYEDNTVNYKDNLKLTNELNTTHYIYDNSKTYKLASFKVKAPSTTAVTINGFSLTNKGNLDINDILDEDEISLKINDKTAKIKSSISNGKLIISLKDSIEISAKGYATFDIYSKLIDLTEFGKYILLSLSETSDIQAIDEKTGAKISIDMNGISWPKIYFDKIVDTTNSGNNNSDNNSTDSSNSNSSNNNSSDDNSSDNNSSDVRNDKCVNIKVTNGNSYCFGITKLGGTKFRISVTNAEEIYGCSITRITPGATIYSSWVFNSCGTTGNPDFTVLPASGVADLNLKISYDGKQYTKRVFYDLTKGIFYERDKYGNPIYPEERNNDNSEDNNSEDNNSEDNNSEDNNSEDNNSEDNNSEDNNSNNTTENSTPEQKELKVTGNSKGMDYKIIDLIYSDTISLDYIQFTNNHDYKIEHTKVKLKIIGTTNPSYITKAGIKRVTSSYNEPCNINKLIPFNGKIGDEFEVSVGTIAENSTLRCGLTVQLQYNHSSRQPDLDDTELGIEIVDVTADDTVVEVNHTPTLYKINQ